jgi:hypothetical protein
MAQGPIATAVNALPVTATIATGTIAVTDTFQAALAANASRRPGGSLTNQDGTNAMYVFFGAVASASKAKSIILAAGATLYFNDVFGPNQAYRGVVAVTGTGTDTFATLEVAAAA